MRLIAIILTCAAFLLGACADDSDAPADSGTLDGTAETSPPVWDGLDLSLDAGAPSDAPGEAPAAEAGPGADGAPEDSGEAADAVDG